jgi:hypothetical protein
MSFLHFHFFTLGLSVACFPSPLDTGMAFACRCCPFFFSLSMNFYLRLLQYKRTKINTHRYIVYTLTVKKYRSVYITISVYLQREYIIFVEGTIF